MNKPTKTKKSLSAAFLSKTAEAFVVITCSNRLFEPKIPAKLLNRK